MDELEQRFLPQTQGREVAERAGQSSRIAWPEGFHRCILGCHSPIL